MDKDTKVYHFLYPICAAICGIIYPHKVVGRENIPEGAAVVCANHSCWVDPFLIAFALTKKNQLCMMAKKELFKNKIVAKLISSLGSFPVDRGHTDLNAFKAALKRLKDGKKLGIFPEGTRTQSDEMQAKQGVVVIAERVSVPILPVYVPRVKKLFKRMTIVIGEPVNIARERGIKRTKEEYQALADEIMTKIKTLGEKYA